MVLGYPAISAQFWWPFNTSPTSDSCDVKICYESVCNDKHIPAFPDSEVVSMIDLLSTYLNSENDQDQQMWVSIHTPCSRNVLKTAVTEKLACEM